MAEETTSEVKAPGAQHREHGDPTERAQPIPILAAVAIVALLLFGAGYIVFADPPGPATLGDRRTLADLQGSAQKPVGTAANGQQLYAALCVACHQASGKGVAGVFPPLDASEWVVGDERVLANILLHGIEGEIMVAGVTYKGAMPAFKQLSDAELAALATFVRAQWSNKAAVVTAESMTLERKASTRTTPFAGGAELKALAPRPP